MKLLEALVLVKRVEISALSQKKTSHCWEAFWSGLRDSNPRPSPWQGRALLTRPLRKWRIPNKIGVFGEDPDHRFSLLCPFLSPWRVHFRVHPPINTGVLGKAIRRISPRQLSYSRRVILFPIRQAAAPVTRTGWESSTSPGSHGARRRSKPSRLPFLHSRSAP